MNTTINREQLINSVRDLVLPLVNDSDAQAKLAKAKLVYGIGKGHYRGITHFQCWQTGQDNSKADFIEIAATGEESSIQLAGTTIHELAHVLAGYGQGHNSVWKESCALLGLRHVKAAGTIYLLANFSPIIREQIYNLVTRLGDGKPCFNESHGFTMKIKPCPLGIGTRGGTSRGKGSGSRLRLYHCGCNPPVKVRVASDEFDATCNRCHCAFKQPSDDNIKLAVNQ